MTHVRRKMAEEESLVEGASEKLRLKIRTTRRSEEVEVAPDCTVKEVGVIRVPQSVRNRTRVIHY